MKIALFHNLPSGGGKRAVYEWVRRLSEAHEFTVYSFSSANHEFCDLRPFVREYSVLPFTPRGLFRSPFGRLNQLQRWLDLGQLEQGNDEIAQKINASDADLVFANTCMFTTIPALLKHVEKPSLYYLHEPFGPNFFRDIPRPYIKPGNLRAWVDRFDPIIHLYQSRLNDIQRRSVEATVLLANSCFTQQQMMDEYGVDSHFSPLGIDLGNFYPLPGVDKENLVVSVGEMSPRKGFDFLVHSLACIPVNVRPALKLACNTIQEAERSYIANLADQFQVDLEIMSSLNVDQLRELYNRARICVYSPYLEPFGLVPLEAMACGTPVVGVREGGVQESVVHEVTGLLVNRDPAEFAEAVARLLMEPKLAQEYGQNAREHVETNWTIEKSTDELENNFHRVISSNIKRYPS
jgi:glycosyltransferase involved in cell wall biosynthesis